MTTYETLFEIISFIFFGLSMEIIFSVTGIELCLGQKLRKQTPHKYLEGFVSLYMIPIHGLGVYFLYKPAMSFISDWHLGYRYLFWCFAFTSCEVIGGFVYKKILGFYPWDYYKKSKYKVFKEGYTLWTLIPNWGIAGLILEKYVTLVTFLSAQLKNFN
tara:strand:- start:276 stop:752 length:477 start_codon:yes stop_codon:yes gene_type:complete